MSEVDHPLPELDEAQQPTQQQGVYGQVPSSQQPPIGAMQNWYAYPQQEQFYPQAPRQEIAPSFSLPQDRDMQLLLSKLDLISARLDVLAGRLDAMERYLRSFPQQTPIQERMPPVVIEQRDLDSASGREPQRRRLW